MSKSCDDVLTNKWIWVTIGIPTQTTVCRYAGEEFFREYGDGGYELVDGLVVENAMPNVKHGKVCSRLTATLQNYIDANPIGHSLSHDTLFYTRRRPDTLRGPDVFFVSHAKLPANAPVPKGTLTVIPEVTFEVRSPSDSWNEATAKALDYLSAGVQVAVVLDPSNRSATVFRPDSIPQNLEASDELTIPDHLPGFAVPVHRFFE